jgi:hypothetical protein
VPAAPAGLLEHDVPCAGCGYDLRGLTPPGRCPECGFDLLESIRAFAARSQGWLPPDPAWARQIREGAWLSLISFALALFAVLAPERWYRLPFRNAPLSAAPGRILFLAVACGWWVLSWAAAWKLTRSEPTAGGRRSWRFWGWAARALCTTHFLIPFAWATDPSEYKRGPIALLLLAMLLGGLAGGFALLIRIGQLLRRTGAWVSMGAAWVAAGGLVALIFFVAGDSPEDPSSLSLMFGLPLYPYGPPWVYQYFSRWEQFDPAEPLVWVFLALPLLGVSLMLRLAWAYRPASLLRAAAVASK